jgi:hypothetical protein
MGLDVEVGELQAASMNAMQIKKVCVAFMGINADQCC